MKKRYIYFFAIMTLLFISKSSFATPGNITVGLSGNNPLLVNVAGDTQNEEAGNINIYVYYKNAELVIGGVDASQLVTTFGWGTFFETIIIENAVGGYNVNGSNYTHRLFYGNAGALSPDDLWTPAGVNALSITFTNGASGEAFIALQASDGMADYAGSPHSVSFTSPTATPLPVELSSFSVNSVEGTKAQLQWETATEVNNYGFEIERSLAVNEDGQSESKNEPNWEKVTFVKGHGNSNSTKTYSFTDKNLVGGSKFIYRLKQIDIDGTFEYSDAVEIEVLPNKYELLQNYPNPFNPETNIKFSLPEDAKIAINIYNVLGERVATILNKDLKAGFHQVNFNTTSAGYKLSSGVYIYTLESKSFSQVKKMILMK